MRCYLFAVCLACALCCRAAADPLTGILACRALTDPAARLACFDRETAALASAPAAPAVADETAAAAPQGNTAPAVRTVVQAAPVLDAQQSFGLSGSAIAAHEEAAGARPQKLAKIEARVVALALAGNGRTLFTLDNTQVWQQLESDGDMLAKLGDSATISRGLLGSYWLQLKNGRGCKVTRVR